MRKEYQYSLRILSNRYCAYRPGVLAEYLYVEILGSINRIDEELLYSLDYKTRV